MECNVPLSKLNSSSSLNAHRNLYLVPIDLENAMTQPGHCPQVSYLWSVIHLFVAQRRSWSEWESQREKVKTRKKSVLCVFSRKEGNLLYSDPTTLDDLVSPTVTLINNFLCSWKRSAALRRLFQLSKAADKIRFMVSFVHFLWFGKSWRCRARVDRRQRCDGNGHILVWFLVVGCAAACAYASNGRSNHK